MPRTTGTSDVPAGGSVPPSRGCGLRPQPTAPNHATGPWFPQRRVPWAAQRSGATTFGLPPLGFPTSGGRANERPPPFAHPPAPLACSRTPFRHRVVAAFGHSPRHPTMSPARGFPSAGCRGLRSAAEQPRSVSLPWASPQTVGAPTNAPLHTYTLRRLSPAPGPLSDIAWLRPSATAHGTRRCHRPADHAPGPPGFRIHSGMGFAFFRSAWQYARYAEVRIAWSRTRAQRNSVRSMVSYQGVYQSTKKRV